MRYWETHKPKKSSAGGAKRARAPKRSIASGGSIRQYPFLRRFYQHQAVISDGLQKFLFFLLMATLLYAFVLGDSGIIRIVTLEQDKSALEKELALLTSETEALQEAIDRVKNDPFMMEKLGRERYGYVYPGDKVYKLIQPEKK
jgi:cell division protein FtsB